MLGKLFEPEEPSFTLERSLADLQLKTEANIGALGLGGSDRWDADLDAGTLVFTFPDRVVTSRVQVVGTYSPQDRTWLWGWDHPSIGQHLAEDARLAREFGARYRLADYTTRTVSCDEEQAWQFAAVACYLAKATGAYRGPSDTAFAFMTFHDVQVRPPGR